MSAGAASLPEREHRAGTTWIGYALTALDSDGNPIDFTGATARMTWRDSNNAIVMDWTEGDGLAFDADRTTGILNVFGPGVVDVSPGMLRFDLKVWLNSGEVFVDIDGCMKVVEGITQEMPV